LQQKLQNEAEAKEEAKKEAEKRQQKELIEAQRAADKKQLMEAYVTFQEKQKSQGREAAILEHKSKFEPKPRPFGEAVREGVGDCTEPKAASPPLFRPIKKAVGTRGRISDCLIAHSRNNMDQTRHSGPYFESPATNVDGLNLQCGGGAFERPQNAERGDSGKGLSEMNSVEKLRTRRLALENNFPPLSGLSPDVSKPVKILKPAKTTADAIRLVPEDCPTPSGTSKRKDNSEGAQTRSLGQTDQDSQAKRPKTKIVKKGIAKVVKKGRR